MMTSFRTAVILSLLVGTAFVHAAESQGDWSPLPYGPGTACLGGVGGVYLLAEPGELTIDVCKRDRNRRGSTTELRAILAGPDRRVIAQAAIPDDGQPRGSGWGPIQRTRLTSQVPRKGIYVLNVTVSQDRYGEEMAWGFATTCPRYLIETARGHRDQRHEEPIVLADPTRPGDVCFRPRRGPLSIEVSGLPANARKLELFDADGKLLREMAVGAEGQATCAVAADVPRDRAPWRLHLPVAQGTIQIDGLTRWDDNDLAPNLCCWTAELAADFPLLDYRWLLTPYSRTVYARPGEQSEVVFRVRNNSGQPRAVQLAVEFPSEPWPVSLSAEQITVGGNQTVEVTARCTAAADGLPRTCHLRATVAEAPSLSTYSTLEVRTGQAPATQPLAVPLVLQPYQHENEQFGYLPDYPLDNQVYFDPEHRPFIATGDGIARFADGQWITADLRSAMRPAEGGSERTSYQLAGTKIAFDWEGGVYALARSGRQAALLRSIDGGRTFAAWTIPGRESQSTSYDFEQFSGHNNEPKAGTGADRPEQGLSHFRKGPPPIVRFALTGSDPKLFWRRLHDLELFVPRLIDDGLVMGEPILISRKCIGLAAHSGIPSSVVSRAGKVHVAWAEATEPDEKVPGVPTFVATYDLATGQLSQPALVGYGAPPNDIHNSPSITMDSQGYLHVLAGTHGKPFQYARSLQPNDASGGWTAAEPVGKDLPQTYIGLVCGPDDTLHLTYRLWRYGDPPHPLSHQATLAYQRKRPGQPWEDPRILIVPPFSEYSVYYHRLTIDPRGRLFLSYDYWSTFWFYRNDHPGRRRSLLTSPDGGQTWRLAASSDLVGSP
ncbi:MAG: BNR repeat-containing protein [Pirellulaceae bacterium]|nr:BNR repeat-containing protein [Pirellulaceae bacterium]